MTTSELFLYARDRLEKEWYDTPKCDQMRQAYEELIIEVIIKRIAACIIRVCYERVNNNDNNNHKKS